MSLLKLVCISCNSIRLQYDSNNTTSFYNNNKIEEISEKEQRDYAFLNIIGIVGSIDNDFCGK